MVFAKLVKNLASEEQFNKQFGAAGANKMLGKILTPPIGIPPIGMPIAKLDELRVAISAAVWKLAEIPSNRDALVLEKAHRSVVDILKETENEDGWVSFTFMGGIHSHFCFDYCPSSVRLASDFRLASDQRPISVRLATD